MPLSWLYGAGAAIRNLLYDKKFLRSVRFDFPVISVGNLTAGGTGKTPHIEYLLRLLQYQYKTAVLSRGYGRISHGFVLADVNTAASRIGDEPRQYKKKFPETIVAVCEDRVLAVPRILSEQPEAEVILLDDAFQHRAIRAGLSVLLTEHNNLFTRDALLPVGWLREAKGNYHRADIIVVTKCPAKLSPADKQKVIEEIKPHRYQKVYFSYLEYGLPYSFYDATQQVQWNPETDVLLVCGIARYDELEQYLKTKSRNVYVRSYKDHHRFDLFDLDNIRETFKNLGDTQKLIVITEKDAARLEEHRYWLVQNKLPILVQPVSVKFTAEEGETFNADILRYIEVVSDKQAMPKIN